MDHRAHYFEFLEKAYDGQITVDIKVRQDACKGDRLISFSIWAYKSLKWSRAQLLNVCVCGGGEGGEEEGGWEGGGGWDWGSSCL